jgi:RNA polymerase sigma-70 factor, ECF subfamily
LNAALKLIALPVAAGPASTMGRSFRQSVEGLSLERNTAYSSGWQPSMNAQAAIDGEEAARPTTPVDANVAEVSTTVANIPAANVAAANISTANANANRELVCLAQGDPLAGLAELHKRFATSVNRLVWRLLGPDADHDDLVQQVFFAMLTSIGQLRDPDKLEVWVRTVTVNAVRQELRRRSVRRLFWTEQKKVQRFGDLVGEVESRELLSQCVAVLDKIPVSQRIVFILHFVEGYSLKEIADMCGYSHITAKRRLKAATLRFRALLQRRPDLLKRLPSEGNDEDEE